MRLHPFTLLLALAPITPAAAQIVDSGFDDVTPPADVDLVVVRERAYGAGGVNLTAYGLTGTHDFVQSIYVRAYHGTSGVSRQVQGRLVFPPGVSILGVIQDDTGLGGSLDDGVFTASDADFAVGAGPDDYSAPGRGLAALADREHACVRSNNTVDFSLLQRQDEVDDFRVLIDYGTSFPAALAFDVQLVVDPAIDGAIAHEVGVRVGDGTVFGGGDFGEVAGLDGVPLTAGAPMPSANSGYTFDPTSVILVGKTGGPLANDHLEGFDPAGQVAFAHMRRGTGRDIVRGPFGYVYGYRVNLPGFAMIDLDTGNVGQLSVSGLESTVEAIGGHPGGRQIVLAGHVSGVNSDFKVHLVDVVTATVDSVVTIPQGMFVGGAGIAWDGGIAHLVSRQGQYARVDFTTATATVTTPPVVGNGTFVAMEMKADGTRAWALRRITGTLETSIYEIDTATGAVTPDVLRTSLLERPNEMTRDSQGHLWILRQVLGNSAPAAMLEVDPSTWTVVAVHGCAVSSEPNTVLADVSPAPLGLTYCTPAVPNNTGRPASTICLGSLAVADNDFHLRVLDLPPQTVGYFLSSRSAGFVALPGGSQGNLCLGAPVGRHNMQAANTTTSTTSFTVQLDLTAIPTAIGPAAVAPGETWYFQCWYRQAPNTSNFTDAIQVAFQ